MVSYQPGEARSSSFLTPGGSMCCFIAPVHLRAGREGGAKRGGLPGPPEAAGGHGSCVWVRTCCWRSERATYSSATSRPGWGHRFLHSFLYVFVLCLQHNERRHFTLQSNLTPGVCVCVCVLCVGLQEPLESPPSEQRRGAAGGDAGRGVQLPAHHECEGQEVQQCVHVPVWWI